MIELELVENVHNGTVAASERRAQHGGALAVARFALGLAFVAMSQGVHAATTDPRYRKMAEAALTYARDEFKEEVSKLKAENAALRKAAAAAAIPTRPQRAAAAPVGHGPAAVGGDGDSIPRLCAKRAGSLGVFLACLSVTTVILRDYEHTLASHVSLAFFVPFLIGHGGNCGGMSVGAIIAALARGDAVTRAQRSRVFVRETVAGVGVAIQLCALTFVALSAFGFDERVSLVVVFSLGAITALSALIGAGAPLLLDAAGLDAATVAPPAVTTLIDALGLVIYLTIAQAVLNVGGGGGAGRGAEL